MKATVTLKAIKDFDIQEGTNYTTSYTAVLDFGSLERGGTPIDAYTKAESDAKFATNETVGKKASVIRSEITTRLMPGRPMQYSSALSVEQISEQITKGNIVVWTLFEREIEAHLFDGGVIGSYIDENSAVMHRIVQTSGNSVTVTDVDMQGGGEPIDAYTKSESDKRFANKDDVYEEVHVGDDEPTDPRTKMWVTDEDLVEIVQEQGTSKSAVMSQDAVTKALASAGGDWELLVDNTTTEEILKWSFSQGEQGQIFDNYKKIMVFFQSQPTAKTSNLRLVWNGQNAWGTQPFVGFSITSTSVTTIGLCVIEKTPLGIVVERHFKSYNNNTLSGDLATTASSSINMATLMTSNQASTTHPFNSEITHITLGSYQVVIGAGSRIVILGKK